MAEVDTVIINQGWSWKQRNLSIVEVVDEIELPDLGEIQEGWARAQIYPSEVHVELLKSGRIPDPYLGFNEHKVQCEYHTAICHW